MRFVEEIGEQPPHRLSQEVEVAPYLGGHKDLQLPKALPRGIGKFLVFSPCRADQSSYIGLREVTFLACQLPQERHVACTKIEEGLRRDFHARTLRSLPPGTLSCPRSAG